MVSVIDRAELVPESVVQDATAAAQRAEVERFAEEILRYLSGEGSPAEFRMFRLENGVYGIRFLKDVHMVRVKIPHGLLRADQLERLAHVAREYCDGKAHVTTRQDVQLYYVPLERIPFLLSDLAEIGLTTREACGNTVRNVTACPEAGVDPTEPFDVTPYAETLARHFLRNPVCQNLPRKFKVAFSGCAEDCAMTAIHDLAFLARMRPADGQEARGFQVLVGGGLGPTPKAAKVLSEFVPADDYLVVAEAVLRVYDRRGNRGQRQKARIKFLVEDLGIEAFREAVLREATVVRQTRPGSAPVPPATDAGVPELPPAVPDDAAPRPGFVKWARANTKPQKQPGFRIVHITLPSGDLTAEQFEDVARLARKYSDGTVRTTAGQNFLLRWAREESLASLHADLLDVGLGAAGANGLANVLACPGADTCNLAVTKSHRLSKYLGDALRAIGETGLADDLADVRIRVSGCPNACGQHHVAPIGLFGSARSIGDRSVPMYKLLLGGDLWPGGVRFGKIVAEVPAKRVPEAVRRVLGLYRARRHTGERFANWTHREGAGLARLVQAELGKLLELASYDEDRDLYRDWSDGQDFVPRIGEGECAAPMPP